MRNHSVDKLFLLRHANGHMHVMMAVSAPVVKLLTRPMFLPSTDSNHKLQASVMFKFLCVLSS